MVELGKNSYLSPLQFVSHLLQYLVPPKNLYNGQHVKTRSLFEFLVLINNCISSRGLIFEEIKANKKIQILDHLSWAEYQNYKLEKSLNHTKELLKIAPEHKRARYNLDVFTENIEEYEKTENELK